MCVSGLSGSPGEDALQQSRGENILFQTVIQSFPPKENLFIGKAPVNTQKGTLFLIHAAPRFSSRRLAGGPQVLTEILNQAFAVKISGGIQLDETGRDPEVKEESVVISSAFHVHCPFQNFHPGSFFPLLNVERCEQIHLSIPPR
jgi:hypothetical protein